MGLLDFFKAQKQPSTTGERVSVENFKTVSTEGMDLSQPYVDDYMNRGTAYVMFGEGNLYPQILNQLYISSPMHQACCNFKKYAICGNGYEWEGYNELSVPAKIDIKQFETMSKLKYATRQIALDFIKHGRSIVLLHFNAASKRYTHFVVVDPEKIRNSRVALFQNTPQIYFYSMDWGLSYSQHQFTPYRNGNTDKWQVAEIRNDVGGFESYGFPDWGSSANWQKVGADIALLHKSAIENGIQPSVIFRYPYVMSPAEEKAWANGMEQAAKGAKNYGRAMKVQANSKEQMPEIDVVNTTDNHALFEQTSKEYKEEVAISHGIDPALMGVRVSGSLGAQDEKEFSAEQFKKVWLNDNKDVVESFINELSMICGVTAAYKLKETDLLTVKEVMEMGVEKPNAETFSVQTNDALRGLTAKENMDMIRIVRDFGKGKLSEPLARTRLAAYGIDSETITNLLSE